MKFVKNSLYFILTLLLSALSALAVFALTSHFHAHLRSLKGDVDSDVRAATFQYYLEQWTNSPPWAILILSGLAFLFSFRFFYKLIFKRNKK